MSAVTTPIMPNDLFRLSVEQYHELIDAGTLGTGDRVELLEGILFRKMSKNPPHSYSNGRIQQIIGSALHPGWLLRLQEPITLSDSEPEPDAAIARGTIDDYSAKHPHPLDLALVIEVADTSLERDRGIKLRSYAGAGIVCYWIVNLIDRQIELYTNPDATTAPSAYPPPEIFKPGSSLPLKIGDQTIAMVSVADILPKL